MRNLEIGIIGGGISGVSVAQEMRGKAEPVIYETEESLGGLIRCKRTNDCLYHLVGGHVFNSKTPQVTEWFKKRFNDSDFNLLNRNAKINIFDRLVGYPIENHIYQLPEALQRKIIEELIEPNSRNESETKFFGNFLLNKFGKTLYKNYFYPYNQKIWNQDLNLIPIASLEGKLPSPSKGEIVFDNFNRKSEKRMVHSTFSYPREGGSQYIIDSLASQIAQRRSTKIVSIVPFHSKVILNNTFSHDMIIYTGDITRLGMILSGIDDELNGTLATLSKLKSRGIANAFCECDPTDLSWMYLPNSDTPAHRIIYTGTFAESNNRGSTRITCVVEFAKELNNAELVSVLSRLPGNMKLIETNSIEKAYIIQSDDTREIIDKAKKQLEKYNIYLLGRFAEWEYYNMDKCIEAAISLGVKLKEKYYV